MNKKYLLVKGSGGAGLGDKIRALLCAILYARLTGRVLCVDWRDTAYGSGQINLFDELFRLRDIPYSCEIPESDSVYPSSWQRRLGVSFDEIRALDGAKLDGSDWNRQEAIDRYSFDQGKFDFPQDVLVMWEFDQWEKMLPRLFEREKKYKTWNNLEIQSDLAQKHLGINDVIVSTGNEVKNRIGKVIGVHVRLTDESQKIRDTPTYNQYWQAIKRASKSMKEFGIFLAADNKAVVEAFITRYGKEKVSYIDKWFPEPGEPIHKNRSCPDGVQAARDAVLDLWLLAHSDSLIVLGNSSFSSLARIFSQLSKEKTIVLWPELTLRGRLKRILGKD